MSRHCRVESRGAVALVVLDVAGRSLNVLDTEVLKDIGDAVVEADALPFARAVVVISGKPAGFCAGADVEAIGSVRSEEQGRAAAALGQATYARIERVAKPVVAAVHGACLGGGLELALACDAIVATDAPNTKLGLPEVRLGIVPGFGGTQRLPRRIRFPKALELILTGRTLAARQAKRAGIVDDVVPREFLESAACEYAIRLADGKPPLNAGARGGVMAAILRAGPVRRFIIGRARARILRETRGVYPAPLAALDVVERAFGSDRAAGYAAEAAAVGKLLADPVSHRFIDLFRTTEALKKSGVAPDWQLDGKTIGIIGAGVMGSGIALAVLRGGGRVRLVENRREALEKGCGAIARDVRADVERGRLSRRDGGALLDRLEPSLEISGLRRAAVVIEAVVEKHEVKRDVFRAVERQVDADTILATNTSSLSVAALAAELDDPRRLVGLHFFNPVARMPLVEVVVPAGANAGHAAIVTALVRDLGKTPMRVTDSPGFLVNRVLAPYLAEALLLLEDGASPETIEGYHRDLGFPMGPLHVIDAVGLDVANEVARVLAPFLGARVGHPRVGERLAAAGHLGDKTRGGIHVSDSRRRSRPAPWLADALAAARAERSAAGDRSTSASDLDRPFLLLLAEAARAWADRVAAEPRFVDAAMVLGAGFPASLGGPLTEIVRRGPSAVLDRLRALASIHGPRFLPDAALEAAFSDLIRFGQRP